MTIEQINEALRIVQKSIDNGWTLDDEIQYGSVRVLAAAALRLVGGWEPCPTCRGSGWREWPLNVATNANDFAGESCPDCVDGSVPGPELVERVAQALYRYALGESVWERDHQDMWRAQARAVLLASHRGGTE